MWILVKGTLQCLGHIRGNMSVPRRAGSSLPRLLYVVGVSFSSKESRASVTPVEVPSINVLWLSSSVPKHLMPIFFFKAYRALFDRH